MNVVDFNFRKKKKKKKECGRFPVFILLYNLIEV